MSEHTFSFMFINTPPKPWQLDWYAFQLEGIEILRQPENREEWGQAGPILREDELKEGDKILFFGLFGECMPGVVKVDKYGVRYFNGSGFIGSLTFGHDARECWVCTGLGNLKALERINFE